MIAFAETVDRLRADRVRLVALLAGDPVRRGSALCFDPSYQAVFLHRWSHYFFSRGNRLLARFLWHLNLYLTGADISPISDIAGGLVIVQPIAVVLIGKSGSNLTVYGHAGFGGGVSRENIGVGPGLPVLGDDVVLEFGSYVIGAVRLGSGTRVGPLCGVKASLPDRSEVIPGKLRIRRIPNTAAADDEAVNG